VGVVLVRLGSHDGYLVASDEAGTGSVMTKGGGAVRVAGKPRDDFMDVVLGVKRELRRWKNGGRRM
jgi:hypothetical protein